MPAPARGGLNMSRSTAKGLQILCGILFMIIIVVLAMHRLKGLAYLALAAWLVISLGLNSKLKCTHCGAWPRKGSFFHSYCPDCGEKLDD